MSQAYLPGVVSGWLRVRLFIHQVNLGVVLGAIALMLSLFNTYRAHFYRTESLYLLVRTVTNPSGPDVKFRQKLFIFNSGTTTVAVESIRAMTWTDIIHPAGQGIVHGGTTVSDTIEPFIIKGGETTIADLNIAFDGRNYFSSDTTVPLADSSERQLTLQLEIEAVGKKGIARRLAYPYMHIKLNPDGTYAGGGLRGFSPDIFSISSSRDLHWGED
jgi:hypothetical protein